MFAGEASQVAPRFDRNVDSRQLSCQHRRSRLLPKFLNDFLLHLGFFFLSHSLPFVLNFHFSSLAHHSLASLHSCRDFIDSSFEWVLKSGSAVIASAGLFNGVVQHCGDLSTYLEGSGDCK